MEPVVVFLGPTLSHEAGRAELDGDYRPPAGHGDVLRAALRRPRAIALVDGVFERQPAVWHKEILFALSEGIHVYGAASMGALRAAELDGFGMRGVGDVYRAYAEGLLEDDDEVAVAHADGDHDFRALSDSMVDVRATLDAAVAAGVVRIRTADSIVERVKATFYAHRMLVAALDPGNAEHERLRAWVSGGWVHRKRDDALALLRRVRADLAAGLEPFRPAWTLQRTRYWEDARHGVETAAVLAPAHVDSSAADAGLAEVLDELRLDPDRYRTVLDRALVLALARDAAAGAGVDVSAWAAQAALDHERRLRGLLEPRDVASWLDESGLEEDGLAFVARRLAVLRWARDTHRLAAAGELALEIRSDAGFADLLARAVRKRDVLASQPSADTSGYDDAELIAWYFGERLATGVPPALDAWLAEHGWRNPSDFLRALRAEWAYRDALAHGR